MLFRSFINLSDRYCTGSSIMPQKRNPDVAELARGKSGRVVGHLMGLITLMKGQPLAYNKDNQEDKEPLFDTVDTVKDTLRIMAEMIGGEVAADGSRSGGLTVKAEAMEAAALRGYATATDLADYLVKKGLPFRDAHEVVAHEAPGTERLERGPEGGLHRGGAGEQALAIEDVEDGEPGRHGDRVAAEREDVLERRARAPERVPVRLPDRDRAERRVAAGDPLAHRDHVRHDAPAVDRERRAGPPEAGDDLVHDEEDAVAVADLAHEREVVVRRCDRAAHGRDDRLRDEGGDAAGARIEDRPLELRGIALAAAVVVGRRAAVAVGRRDVRRS